MTVNRLNRFCLALVLVIPGPGAAFALEEGGAPASAAQESPAPEAGVPAASEKKPVIQTLGEADQKIFVVDHGRTWSMHFDNVITGNVLRLWQGAGGPAVTTKLPIDRTFTMSVHELAPELILERLLEGYGYTLHYDDDGRLASVRVYSPRESLAFKTPRLTESLSRWKEVETGGGQPAASEPEQE